MAARLGITKLPNCRGRVPEITAPAFTTGSDEEERRLEHAARKDQVLREHRPD